MEDLNAKAQNEKGSANSTEPSKGQPATTEPTKGEPKKEEKTKVSDPEPDDRDKEIAALKAKLEAAEKEKEALKSASKADEAKKSTPPPSDPSKKKGASVTATRKGETRRFTVAAWNQMPKDKYGWKQK